MFRDVTASHLRALRRRDEHDRPRRRTAVPRRPTRAAGRGRWGLSPGRRHRHHPDEHGRRTRELPGTAGEPPMVTRHRDSSQPDGGMMRRPTLSRSRALDAVRRCFRRPAAAPRPVHAALTGSAIARLVAAVAVTAIVTAVAPAVGRSDAPGVAGAAVPPGANAHWVDTWVSMPQLTEPGNMPPPPFTGTDRVLADSSLRQTVRVTTGGSRIRLRLSNAFGGAALPVTKMSVAAALRRRDRVPAIPGGAPPPGALVGRPPRAPPAGGGTGSRP